MTSDFVDPLQVFDREGLLTTSLRNLLGFHKVGFLIGGGPSFTSEQAELLRQRGVWSIAVNNVAAWCRPNAFVCSDPPSKFHNGIWQDPSVMKFVPTAKLTRARRGRLREKLINGEFKDLFRNGQRVCVQDCPNTWGISRRTWWKYDDTFFRDEAATWGNGGHGAETTGNPKTMCTMLLAMRILYYLGARQIFLVGVDFCMTDQGYSFEQGRTTQAVSQNNEQYVVINRGLCQMASSGVFDRYGVHIYNCYQNSGLRAFPHVTFETAMCHALDGFPLEPLSLSGWYEKGPKKEAK